jgi:hypothetical protein
MPKGSATNRRVSGESSEGSGQQRIDISVRRHWMRTGYRYFPYAAWQSDQWWVLRANYCFPEHDLVTLFIDGRAVADITAPDRDARRLVASIAALDPISPLARVAYRRCPRSKPSRRWPRWRLTSAMDPSSTHRIYVTYPNSPNPIPMNVTRGADRALNARSGIWPWRRRSTCWWSGSGN